MSCKIKKCFLVEMILINIFLLNFVSPANNFGYDVPSVSNGISITNITNITNITTNNYYSSMGVNSTQMDNSTVVTIKESWIDSLWLRIVDFFTPKADNNFLYNDSNTIYFNNTMLNETIGDYTSNLSSGSAGENPFNQSLNTTDNVIFNDINTTGNFSFFDSDTGTYRIRESYMPSTGLGFFGVNTSEDLVAPLMVILTQNHLNGGAAGVGIGTVPEYPFEVKAGTSDAIALTSDNWNGGNDGQRLVLGAGGSWGDNFTSIQTILATTERPRELRLNNLGGVVSIGLRDSLDFITQTLDVSGSANLTGTIFINNGTDVSTAYVPYNGSISNVDLGIYNITTTGFGTINSFTVLGNLTVNGNYICNATSCFTFEELNKSSSVVNYWASNGSNIYNTTTWVGIGTANPTTKLEVNGSISTLGNNTQVQINKGGVISDTNGVVVNDRAFFGYIQDYAVVQGSVAKGILFIVNNTTFGSGITAMKITSSGNVGIGTTTPTEKLMVNGSMRVQNSSGTLALYINDSTGNVGIGTTLDIVGNINSNSNGISTDSNSISFTNYRAIFGYENLSAYMQAGAGKGIILKVNASDTVVTIISSGKVGIGTTSPTDKLMVNGSMRVQNTSGSLALYVNDSTGWVGLGTKTPNATLDINGGFSPMASLYGIPVSINMIGGLRIKQLGGTGGTGGIVQDGNGDFVIGTETTNNLRFFASNSERMRINGSNGFIGIGTTAPLYPLTIAINTSAANRSVSAYFHGNITAKGLIARTSVYDSSKNVWDYIRNSSYYLNPDGSINHKNFYGYTDLGIGYDYGNPITTKVDNQVCEDVQTGENCKEVQTGTYDNGEPIIETKCTPVYENKCYIETHDEISYNQIHEEGVDLGSEVSMLTQAVYELNNRVTTLENDNNKMKLSLCKLGERQWC